MIYLFTIASPPRSGTRWYSGLFTTDRSYCYHELSSLSRPYPTNLVLMAELRRRVAGYTFEQAQRRMLLEGFPHYFERLWERATFGQYHVGNSDCGFTTLLPALWLAWPDMRFLFSFRNGINQVNSAYAWKANVGPSLRDQNTARFGTADYFAQCCHSWRQAVARLKERRAWLEERGASLRETRLELMTGDVEELRAVWTWLVGEWPQYERRNRELMSSPVNSRVNIGTVFSWEQVWDGWSTHQQEAFAEICGETQIGLDYQLPPVGGEAGGSRVPGALRAMRRGSP